jgi:hypothetical protein
VAGLHPVFIDDAQIAKAHKARVVILVEGEGVICVEPVEVEVAAIFRWPNGNHCLSSFLARRRQNTFTPKRKEQKNRKAHSSSSILCAMRSFISMRPGVK